MMEFYMLHGRKNHKSATASLYHFIRSTERRVNARDDEFTTLESYCKVMKPLVDIIKAIGGERWATISTVRPLLLNNFFSSSSRDSELEKAMKKSM